MQKRALEITCYVAGAGSFGVFVRWLQVMLAFDENGLAKNSVFNILVPVMIVASAIVFNSFNDKIKEERLYVPKEFCEALFNPGRIYAILRWVAGGTMCVGAVLLLAACETDKNADMLRVLAACGFFSGLSFPLYLDEANYEDVEHPGLIRLYSLMPIVFYAVWLVVCYKENSLNSEAWDFVLEIATIIVAMLAFFRVAGFAYLVVNGRKCMFYVRLAGAMCIMALADERYMGEQLMLLGTAMMMLLYNWILLVNLKKKKAAQVPDEDVDPDGFVTIKRYKRPEE